MKRKAQPQYMWIILAVGLLALLWTRQVYAQTPVPGTAQVSDDEVNAVARQLFCPVCENTPLDVCATQACAQWRELIRTKLSQGWTAEQIKQYFATQYGARVLSEPPQQGLNWLVYIVPPVLMLVGVYIVFRAFQSMRKSALAEANETEPDAQISEEYLSKIEEELKKRQ